MGNTEKARKLLEAAGRMVFEAQLELVRAGATTAAAARDAETAAGGISRAVLRLNALAPAPDPVV